MIRDSLSPRIKFGTGKRQNLSTTESVCKGEYEIAGRIGGKGEGFTFGEKLSPKGNKNDYPSPNKYLPPLLESEASIFMYKSNRPSPVSK